jgi:hypothetical protein
MMPDLKMAPKITSSIAVTIRLLLPSLFTDNSNTNDYIIQSQQYYALEMVSRKESTMAPIKIWTLSGNY